MKNECRLCGGKLRGGICSECGMDNRKSDDMYRRMLNRGECGNEAVSHVHDDHTGKAKKYQEPTGTPQKQERKYNQTQPRKPAQKKAAHPSGYQPAQTDNSRQFTGFQKKKRKGAGMTAVISVLMISSALMGLFSQLQESSYMESVPEPAAEEWIQEHEADEFPEWDENIDFDYYGSIEEELNPEGSSWEGELTAGIYVVGADLPEGEYTVTGIEGSSYKVFDDAHYLAVTESFGTEEYDIQEAVGVKLFQGAIVFVDGMYPVRFVTENGQIQNLTGRTPNPLTDSVEVSEKGTAGVDFPPGTYDVAAVSGNFGAFRYDILQPYWEYPFSVSTFMDANPTDEYPSYCAVYKNVVLPEGTVIKWEGFKVRLIPSEGITTEDYAGFYDNVQ